MKVLCFLIGVAGVEDVDMLVVDFTGWIEEDFSLLEWDIREFELLNLSFSGS